MLGRFYPAPGARIVPTQLAKEDPCTFTHYVARDHDSKNTPSFFAPVKAIVHSLHRALCY